MPAGRELLDMIDCFPKPGMMGTSKELYLSRWEMPKPEGPAATMPGVAMPRIKGTVYPTRQASGDGGTEVSLFHHVANLLLSMALRIIVNLVHVRNRAQSDKLTHRKSDKSSSFG